jgi:hypothetical protein
MIANMNCFAHARRRHHTLVYDALFEEDGIFLHQEAEPLDLPPAANRVEPALAPEVDA